MFDDVIKSLSFSSRFEGEQIDLSGLKHTAIPFSPNNFHAINTAGTGSIAFIDGGNAELLKSPNFSLHFCRTAAVVFENGKRTAQNRNEFFVLVTVENGKFIAKTFGADLSFSFAIDDEHFKIGKSNGTPSAIALAVRRFAELELASETKADVIVLDGSLQQTYPFENTFFEKLSGKNVIGFCKTSSVLTTSGNSAVALMNLHKGQFAYHPVASVFDESYKAAITFVRLHDHAQYVFKLDFSNNIDANALSLLAMNAVDPVFLGYPYGLVLADKLARVSNDEAEYLRTKFISKIKDEDLLRYLNALNAHDVLDRI